MAVEEIGGWKQGKQVTSGRDQHINR